jgi:hypothetical protein
MKEKKTKMLSFRLTPNDLKKLEEIRQYLRLSSRSKAVVELIRILDLDTKSQTTHNYKRKEQH